MVELLCSAQQRYEVCTGDGALPGAYILASTMGTNLCRALLFCCKLKFSSKAQHAQQGSLAVKHRNRAVTWVYGKNTGGETVQMTVTEGRYCVKAPRLTIRRRVRVEA